MDKTFSYYIEKFIGLVIGTITAYLVFKYWYKHAAITTDKYYDLIIKVCSTLFGFLLTLLGLIVNSSSKAVSDMRNHGSYKTLISYHKIALSISFGLLLYSIFLYLIISPIRGIEDFVSRYGEAVFKLIVSFHSGICIWGLISITIFVRLFYKIVLSDAK